MTKNLISEKSKLINLRGGEEIRLTTDLLLKIARTRAEIYKVVE